MSVCGFPPDFSRSAVFVMRPDGSNLHRVTPWDDQDCDNGWAPDGRHLAVSSNAFRPNGGLVFVVDTWTRHLVQLTDLPLDYQGFGDFDVAWSGDGSRIAFATDRDGCCDIEAVDVRTRAITDLTPGNPPWDSAPSWSAAFTGRATR